MYSYQKYKDTFRVIHSDASDLTDFESEFQTSEEAAARVNYLNGGSGLTKRETFALAIITGFAADTDLANSDLTENAWNIADKIIDKLDVQANVMNPVFEPETFQEYLKQARQEFASVASKYSVSKHLELRTAIDDILIAFDQSAERVKSCSVDMKEFDEWLLNSEKCTTEEREVAIELLNNYFKSK